ncbi:hypothetical protein Poli38472_007685 [Pythium oligandrum]|uniref:Uncharacterized protein n=1 Tax=Pythium oligandrum TaxID=41045 RepID=A0A8K1CS92_PYTOL|nr:hypothetical protein Poli38472_007685 [Pythium oligandrum]|eukprot:TMW68013.1 hypothetical protein Poli38472_007685 [Pythium oligandrum]
MVSQSLSASSSLNVDLFSMATTTGLGELSVHTMPMNGTMPVNSEAARTPMHCKYPSKKCWNMRVEKRNGELHKFCEYHRQKANSNQRRMEQRRKQLRTLQINSDQTHLVDNIKASYMVSSPSGVDQIDLQALLAKRDMCMDVPFTPSDMIDFDVGVDAAVDCMMIDNDIEMEPSDRPVDLYEADLFFLEHFMTEITRSVI